MRLRGRGFFAVAGLVWALTVVYLPSAQPHERVLGQLAAPGDPGGPDVQAASGAPDASTGDGGQAATSAGAPGAPRTTIPQLSLSTGVTRGGVVCRPGVNQVPDTGYAPPCRPKFTGDNGGATYNGVTATTIRMAIRYFGPSVLSPTGGGLDATERHIDDVFLKWFTANYEVYGRQVVFDEYQTPHGDYLSELGGKGRDAACEDAIALAQEHHDFGVIYSDTLPFMDCAAQQGLVITDVESRPSEPFLAAHDPFLWASEQECYRISYQMAEYMGKRLAHRPAKYAGEADYMNRDRRFGIVVPDVPGYHDCYAIIGRELHDKYGVPDISEFHYQADLSTVSEQVSRAVIQFKSEGVTTVSVFGPWQATQFLTQGARNQDWHPEWLVNGVGGDDTDDSAQQYDQSEVAGHMIGRSEYSADANYIGTETEGGRLYRKLTGQPLPDGYGDGGFAILNQLFTFLQQAGPNLTPYTLGRGVRALPARAGPQGAWSYRVNPDGTPGFSHSATIDANEIWYDATIIGSNGKRGGWHVNPQRYAGGQWPTTPPEVYPGR